MARMTPLQHYRTAEELAAKAADERDMEPLTALAQVHATLAEAGAMLVLARQWDGTAEGRR